MDDTCPKREPSTVEAGRSVSMEDLSHDFDVLAERADDCGALWAVRLLRRLLARGEGFAGQPDADREARHLSTASGASDSPGGRISRGDRDTRRNGLRTLSKGIIDAFTR
jgi:hypothetical protein